MTLESSFRRPHLRGTGAGEPVLERGSKAVGTGSLDVAMAWSEKQEGERAHARQSTFS